MQGIWDAGSAGGSSAGSAADAGSSKDAGSSGEARAGSRLEGRAGLVALSCPVQMD